MKRIRQLTLVIVALVALVVPAIAQASPDQVKRDCNEDGALSKKYSKQELQKALDTLEADLADYSDCEDVIKAALAGAGKKKSGGGGGAGGSRGGGAAPDAKTPTAKPDPAADAAAFDQARRGGKPKLNVGGKPLEPGKNGLFNLSASNGLPTPLLLALIGLGLVAICAALITLRKRVPALARIPLPSLSLESLRQSLLESLRRVTPPRFRR